MENNISDSEDETHFTSESTSTNDSTGPKPGMSYIALISLAIQSSPSRKMLLSEIYNWITENYPYYKMEERSWRNSIRHNLSLNECFVKTGRCENGKGNYWSIHPANIDDFANGDFRRRRARRRVRKCDEELQKLVSCEDDVDDDSSISEEPCCTDVPINAYVPMTGIWASTDYLVSLFGADAIMSREERIEYFNRNGGSKEYTTPQIHNGDYVQHNCCQPGYTEPQTLAPHSGYIGQSSGYHHSSTVNVNVNVNVQGMTDGEHTCNLLPTWQDTFSRLQTNMFGDKF